MEGVARMDRIRNEELRNILQVKPASEIIKCQQLRWSGHLNRMEDTIPARGVWQSKTTGRRKRGRPPKTWNDNIEQILKGRGKTWKEAEQAASNRTEWRKLVNKDK